jgi:DNA polymerase-1
MTPRELLTDLQRLGFRLTAEGAGIRVSPASQLSAELRHTITTHKAKLLEELLGNATCDTCDASTTPAVAYTLVRDAAGLEQVMAALDSAAVVAVDVETSGLDPRRDRVRLLQLATETMSMVFIIDMFSIDTTILAPMFSVLAGRELVLHNALFDLCFLWRLGLRPGRVTDLMTLSRLLTAGTREGNSLADLTARELGISLAKEEQKSDWTGDLSPEQLAYAALDARVTLDLRGPIMAKIKAANLDTVAAIEMRAVPAFVWLACAGAPFDAGAWERLAEEAEAAVKELEARLNAAAPARDGGKPWNWRSWQQVKAAFALLGINLPSTGDAVLAAVDHPLAALLREHRRAAQLVKAFGRKWAGFPDGGRIHAGWVQLGTDAGRSSCKGPNLQQVPRDARYRRCFVAPPGRALVKADYGQLQLRIAAKLSGEKRMLAAFRDGADLHALTAQNVTGKADVSKEDRQLAKALNFGLLFSMGARRLQEYVRQEYGQALTRAEARHYRDTFFQVYPGLRAWHNSAWREQFAVQLGNRPPGESRTFLGRRRLFDAKTPLTFRLNSPVQGAEADGAVLAMALLWERRHECPGAVPVLFVHDEIVVECDAGQVQMVAAWLRQAMIDGMTGILDPVPVEVEVSAGPSWGEQYPLREWLRRAATVEPVLRPMPPQTADDGLQAGHADAQAC